MIPFSTLWLVDGRFFWMGVGFQIIGGVLFINFPAEHAMAGLWGGVFVIATGVAAIRER